MAGAKLDLQYQNQAVLSRLHDVSEALDEPGFLLASLGEILLESTQRRFSTQIAPDGTPWQALSPRYQRRKHRNADKILTLRGHLRDSYRYQVSGDELEVGTNSKYAAPHQFGAEIDIAARSQKAYFKQNAAGEVGRLFVKKEKSNFAQWVTMGAHKIRIPARPSLGVSAADEVAILDKMEEIVGGA